MCEGDCQLLSVCFLWNNIVHRSCKKRGKALLVIAGKAVGVWWLLADKSRTEVD